MKKSLLAFIPLGILGCLAIGGASAAFANQTKLSAAPAPIHNAYFEAPAFQTYVPVGDGWVETTDGSEKTEVGDIIRGRGERFWSGGSGFDSQERTFNAMDEFVDTIHKAKGREGWRGAYRTPELTLADNDHRYISFLFGGGEGDIFINIFQVSGEAGSGDRIAGIRTAFNLDSENGNYDSNKDKDDSLKKNAPISCNMVFKYFELPAEIKPGDRFLIYVRDGKTSDYGGFTFGGIHINQTLEDVAKYFSAHKKQVDINGYTSPWNRNASDFVLNYYATDAYYSTVRTAEAALTDADDNFEINDHLSSWAFDYEFSTAPLDFNQVSSDRDGKDWTERMPANKTGNRFFNADTTGIGEGEKYRFVSNEFTLGGTGFVSAKLGGGTAVMSLIDNEGNELVSSRIAEATGTNILNAGFHDASVANIMASGARLNTMSRTYLDASAHLGKRVRVVLSDDRTGGNWGLAYFDEVVTKYDVVPHLRVDQIEQQWGENPTYHGVVSDKYVGSLSTNFGKAYDFVQRYYSLMRNPTNGVSWCDMLNNDDVKNLLSEYKGLALEVKSLVDNAQDYDFGKDATSENFFNEEADTSYTIGETMAYIDSVVSLGSPSGSVLPNISGNDSGSTIIITFASVALFSGLAIGLIVYKRKKANG